MTYSSAHINKFKVVSAAQSARSFCLSASGAQKLWDERERKLALNFALKSFMHKIQQFFLEFLWISVFFFALNVDFLEMTKKYSFMQKNFKKCFENERKIEGRSFVTERERERKTAVYAVLRKDQKSHCAFYRVIMK